MCACVCMCHSVGSGVCRVFIFKDTGVQPHLSVGLTSVRQKGGLPGPPSVIPLPNRHGDFWTCSLNVTFGNVRFGRLGIPTKSFACPGGGP